MQTLNEYQKKAVLDEHEACIVNANVGSGKTTVLIEKIRYLQQVKGVDLKDCVVLTFTNKAANEIKERLETNVQDMYFGTFHSIAMKLLQTVLPVEEAGRSKEFQIMLPEEELELARQLILRYELNIKYKNRLKKRIETFEKKGENAYEDDLKALIGYLKMEKENQNKMTYRDLILYATELLKKHPDIFRPKYLIIDEVQDCDLEQMELIDALKKKETRLFAVGDPNQVIYGWRGSAFQIFSMVKNRYGAVEYSLPINYRSSQVILKAASRFKQNGEMLIGTEEGGEKIKICRHYDPFAEADYLAGRIKELHTQGISYRDIAIFYRLQSQSELLEKVLDREQIPYEVSRKQAFFELPIMNWLYHLMRYLVNENDQTSLIRLLTDKQFGDLLTEKKVLKLLAQEKIEELPLVKQIESFYQFHKETGSPQTISDDWIEKLTKAVHLDERIGVTSSEYQKEKSYADRFFMELKESGKSLQNFVNEAALYGIAFTGEEEAGTKEAVQLMTLHASKGLEFTYVFIIGANPGFIPLRGGKEADEEEEQRLLFVGMTRAKRYLEFSYYTSSPGPMIQAGPSPYLRMIKTELLATPLEEKKDQKQAAEHLQKLKREILRAREETKTVQQEEALLQEAMLSQEAMNVRTRIQHPRYGLGWILSEDEDKIVFDFDDFGEKEMLRMFCNFTIIEE